MTEARRPDRPGKPREHVLDETCWCNPRGTTPCHECGSKKKADCYLCDEHGLVDAPIPSEATIWIHNDVKP